jgi:hypothetical protein
MSATSVRRSGLLRLGHVGGVEFAIGRTSEPWTLPIDVLTISASPAPHLGVLGRAVRAAMPDLGWADIDYGALTPDTPVELPVPEPYARTLRTRLRSIAVATVREPGGGSRGGRATVEAAVRAAAAVVRMADARPVGALGLPLLGGEAAGLPVEEVAAAVVARVRAVVRDVANLRSVVFVCRDDVAERAIRQAWDLWDPVGRRLPVSPAAERLLRAVLTVTRARYAPRATALDVLLGVLSAGRRAPNQDVTAALVRALPDEPAERITRALTRAGAVGLDSDAVPAPVADAPELADVVGAAERIARQVGSSEVRPHHVAVVAVDAEIPGPVLDALGASRQELRDALRDGVERHRRDESAEAWAAVWTGGGRAVRSTPSGVRYADVRSDAESAEDRLGVTADVNAMAALLASTTTSPPLSVALLGDWGSGKSTFMNLVSRRVAVLCGHAAADPDSPYSPTIRQVRFNAWHYSDDHVWVGLVEHLFRALREEAPNRSEEAPSVVELEARLDAARSKRDRLAGELRQIDELEPERGWWGWLWQPRRLALIARAASRQAVHGVRWRAVRYAAAWAALAAVVFVAGTALGSTVVTWFAAVPVVAGLVAPVVSVWRRANEITTSAHRKLVADKERLTEEIAALEAELQHADPVRGLKAVVDELNAGDRYKPFRGLTGQIHQDLSRLDEQMSKLDERTRPRIVLYVDDLDRCTSDRVVHVLQAVNLLLSTSLFIVVVAVDPRWLLAALEEHYGKPLDGRVRALDYLDKIFHVPFAVRPMNDRAGEYLRSLLPDVEPDAAAPPAPPSGDGASEPAPAEHPEIERSEPAAVAAEPRDDAPSVEGVAPQQLRIRPEEAEFLPRIASLLDTPRAVKKAVNLYVLLRAGIPDDELDAFLGDERGGRFQAAALLIAGIVSCPSEARGLLERILRAEPDEPIGSVLRDEPSSVCTRLAGVIDRFAHEFPLLGRASTYQPLARTVARYGFESYALFD